MKWFKHFTNAHNNNSLSKVRMKYGADGDAIYWYCVELVAGDLGHQENITFELKHDAEVIGYNLKVDSAKVEEIMRYMVNLGLFEERNSIITCMKVAKFLDKKNTRNKEIHKVIDIYQQTHEVLDDSISVRDCPRQSTDSPRLSRLDERRGEYNYIVEKKILDHLNEKAHKNFRKVDTNLRLIRARLKSGVSEDQVIAVIDFKVREWGGTEWEKFLRPKTLFTATNFENYLDATDRPQPVREWL